MAIKGRIVKTIPKEEPVVTGSRIEENPIVPKKNAKGVISSTGIFVEQCWCRKCMKFKKPAEFLVSYDTFLDANGFLSICKDCIDQMYVKIFINEQSPERTILKLCRMLNVVYREDAIQSLRKELDTKHMDISKDPGVFGIYKKTAQSFHTEAGWDKGEFCLFVEPSVQQKLDIGDMDFENSEYFQEFWGLGMTKEDYKYLEQEFGRWKQTTKCETQNEIVLVKEICHKQNEIRKARVEGKSVDGLVKSLQEIMKNSALTPALQNAATSGKNMETFGMWVKEIEEQEPAEWLEGEGHAMYRDVADVDGYFQKYFVRPLKNLMLQSKDFNVEDDLEDPEEYETDEDT